MVEASGGRYVDQWVQGPLGQPVAARWGMLGDSDTAVIEMAAASGLHHVSPELRNPLNTTSYGTGELIVAALERGVKRIILGIGGSATNDGGAGMMQALGVILRDKQGARFLRAARRWRRWPLSICPVVTHCCVRYR